MCVDTEAIGLVARWKWTVKNLNCTWSSAQFSHLCTPGHQPDGAPPAETTHGPTVRVEHRWGETGACCRLPAARSFIFPFVLTALFTLAIEFYFTSLQVFSSKSISVTSPDLVNPSYVPICPIAASQCWVINVNRSHWFNMLHVFMAWMWEQQRRFSDSVHVESYRKVKTEKKELRVQTLASFAPWISDKSVFERTQPLNLIR